MAIRPKLSAMEVEIMADFSLVLSTDWTENKRIERVLRAVENLTADDSLSVEATGSNRDETKRTLGEMLRLVTETFGSRVVVVKQGEVKAKIRMLRQGGGCCGVCGGEGHQ